MAIFTGQKAPTVFERPAPLTNPPTCRKKSIRPENLVNEILPKELADPFYLQKKGGSWLSEVRSYIQNNFINGSDVTWGSNEVLNPSITVKQLEEMASFIAAETYKDARRRQKRQPT